MPIPLQDFDFAALDDPEFKEDAVREELVAPLLLSLGYSATGANKIIRGRPLEHPFVSIGSVRRPVKIFPDYLLSVGGRVRWVLDAKAPNEPVDDPDHLSQVYTYAVHRDVRVDLYALCNGREFAAYHVADMGDTPRLRFRLSEIATHWQALAGIFAPSIVCEDPNAPFDKDFGIHLLKLGIPETTTIYFPGVPIGDIGRVFEDLYALNARTGSEGQYYAATFEFAASLLPRLLGFLPVGMQTEVQTHLASHPSLVRIEGQKRAVTVVAHRGTRVEENDREHYMPLRVIDFT